MSAPPLAPPVRWGSPGVFDSSRGRIVLFCGMTDAAPTPQTVPLTDQWEYDGLGWAQIRPRTMPPARYLHALCYDSLRQRVLLFGGQDQPYHNLDDTWQYQSGAWTQLAPANRPPVRRAMAFAYDAARDRAVLFGGVGAVYYGDTWEFDGSDWAMRPVLGPTAREYAVMAFDAARARMVLTDGYNPGNSGLGTTWEYDGTAWTSFATAPYSAYAVHYDPVVQRVVFASGEWDGSSWSQVQPPSVSGWFLLAVDTLRHERIAMKYGTDGRFLTARYDGTRWRSVARRPPPFLVQDTLRQRTLGIGTLDGGGATNIWLWDGRTFEPLATNSVVSSYGMRFPPIHDTVRDVLLVFTPGPGGAYSWHELRYTDWQRIGGGVLPLNGTMAFCFDPQRNRLVLEGYQSGGPGQTWEYDGVAWLQRSPAHQPFFWLGLNLGYDPLRQVVVLYGGFAPNDTWTWDGVDWTNVPVAHHPWSGNMLYSTQPMTFDTQRGVLLRTGGGETWQFDGTDWAQLPNANLPANAALFAYDAVRDRHIALDATSVYEYAPGPRPRATLFGTGCASSVDTVALDADQPPLLGRDTFVRLRGLPPESGLCFVATGFDDQQHQGTPLPQSLAPYGLAPACTLRIAPALVTFVGHLGGTATLHFVLPGDPALAGVRFFQQAAVIDPLLTTPAPLAVSNAVAFVAGN